MRRAFGSLLAACIALAVAAAVPAAAREPAPLRGTPLGPTGLRLVVADVPPFVLDVDSGAVTRLRGVDVAVDGILWVLGVSRHAAVVVADARDPNTANKRLYKVSDGHARVTPLGSARDVTPDAAGRGIWATRQSGRSACTLGRIGLDARRSASRAIPCNWLITPGGALGLVVHRTSVIDPFTAGEVLATTQGILAVAGRSAPARRAGRTLLEGLRDHARGHGDRHGAPVAPTGADRLVGHPGGRSPRPLHRARVRRPGVAPERDQVLDVWVLDTKTATLTRVPGMPAFVHLKATSMAWTHDGRLVLLGEDEDGGFVGVWRPGAAPPPAQVDRASGALRRQRLVRTARMSAPRRPPTERAARERRRFRR